MNKNENSTRIIWYCCKRNFCNPGEIIYADIESLKEFSEKSGIKLEYLKQILKLNEDLNMEIMYKLSKATHTNFGFG